MIYFSNKKTDPSLTQDITLYDLLLRHKKQTRVLHRKLHCKIYFSNKNIDPSLTQDITLYDLLLQQKNRPESYTGHYIIRSTSPKKKQTQVLHRILYCMIYFSDKKTDPSLTQDITLYNLLLRQKKQTRVIHRKLHYKIYFSEKKNRPESYTGNYIVRSTSPTKKKDPSLTQEITL